MIELAVRKTYGQAAWTRHEREGRRALHRQVTRRPYWLITRRTVGQLEALTIGSEGDEALAVFTFKEEAEMYLRFWAGAASEDWRTRETSVGELTSVLYGQCASVGQVALDPLPEALGGVLKGLLSVRRGEFVLALLDEEPPVPRRAVTPTITPVD